MKFDTTYFDHGLFSFHNFLFLRLLSLPLPNLLPPSSSLIIMLVSHSSFLLSVLNSIFPPIRVYVGTTGQTFAFSIIFSSPCLPPYSILPSHSFPLTPYLPSFPLIPYLPSLPLHSSSPLPFLSFLISQSFPLTPYLPFLPSHSLSPLSYLPSFPLNPHLPFLPSHYLSPLPSSLPNFFNLI
uniref:Uncharacterized protein n=1 Tax=Cacopsylla melanoneura TaxID=428564 RepID=A0A8D9E984_9HEMI